MGGGVRHAFGGRGGVFVRQNCGAVAESGTDSHGHSGRVSVAAGGGNAHLARIRFPGDARIACAAGDAGGMKQRVITVINAFAVFAALLVLWQLVLWVFRVPPYLLPTPGAVANSVGARFPSLLTSRPLPAGESPWG